jgi:nucleoside-diphosphate-sugar epimerase
MATKLVFGCGYLGLRVAMRWLKAKHAVYAVTRSRERGNAFERDGLHAVVCDIMEPASLTHLPHADTVLFAVGFDRTRQRTIHDVYVDGLRNALDALPDDIRRFIYISSTGVYSQENGQWVDESSPCEPHRDGGKACLDAERLLATHPIGSKSNVLRLAGIYGPGRLPRRADVVNGRPIFAPSLGYMNLIHVDDAADIVLAVDQRAPTPRTYLVSDGHPVLRRDYHRELARLCDAPEPNFVEPAATSAIAQRAASSKRISNRRLLDELAVSLKYPSYREGLAASLD